MMDSDAGKLPPQFIKLEEKLLLAQEKMKLASQAATQAEEHLIEGVRQLHETLSSMEIEVVSKK